MTFVHRCMMPLTLRIKKESQRKVALFQDFVVEEVYKRFNNAVLHGGTAIWRCYAGKRFSEDLDFYLSKDQKKIIDLSDALEKRGFTIIKKKISENSIYSELELNRVRVRLEATFQKVNGYLTDYETVDGSILSIYSLTPEEFVKEKVYTYQKRHKIRDLYDIFFLLRYIKRWEEINKAIKLLMKDYHTPVDEKELRVIILEGITPSSTEMIQYIRQKWENLNI